MLKDVKIIDITLARNHANFFKIKNNKYDKRPRQRSLDDSNSDNFEEEFGLLNK